MIVQYFYLFSPTEKLDALVRSAEGMTAEMIRTPHLIRFDVSDRGGVSLEEQMAAAKHLIVRSVQRLLPNVAILEDGSTPAEAFENLWKTSRVDGVQSTLCDLAELAGEKARSELSDRQKSHLEELERWGSEEDE